MAPGAMAGMRQLAGPRAVPQGTKKLTASDAQAGDLFGRGAASGAVAR